MWFIEGALRRQKLEQLRAERREKRRQSPRLVVEPSSELVKARNMARALNLAAAIRQQTKLAREANQQLISRVDSVDPAVVTVTKASQPVTVPNVDNGRVAITPELAKWLQEHPKEWRVKVGGIT